jgi:outer membrane protein assembly factor BamB
LKRLPARVAFSFFKLLEISFTTLGGAISFSYIFRNLLIYMESDVFIIGSNGYVSSIRTSDGEELWRTKLREGLFGGSGGSDVSVLIEGDRIFAGCSGRIYALRASDGKILWSNDLKGIGFNQVALAKQGTSVQFITRIEGTESSSSNS